MTLGNEFAGQLVLIDYTDPNKIIIIPAMAIPKQEAWLYENKQAIELVRQGLAQASEGRFSEAPPDLDGDAALAAGLSN